MAFSKGEGPGAWRPVGEPAESKKWEGSLGSQVEHQVWGLGVYDFWGRPTKQLCLQYTSLRSMAFWEAA
jgi:hypothetical protein